MNPHRIPLSACALLALIPSILSAETVAEATFSGMSATNVTTLISPSAGANDFTWGIVGGGGAAANLDILADPSPGIASGEALQIDATASWRGTTGTFAAPVNLQLGETLTLSFKGRYVATPANNASGLRFGFTNAAAPDNSLFATVGTGGSTDFQIKLDDNGPSGDGLPAAGSSFTISSTASGSAFASLASNAPFTASFSITRNADDYTVVGDFNGSILTGTTAGFTGFDSIVVRNGSLSSSFRIDDIAVKRSLPPTLTRNYTYSGGSLTVNYALHSVRGPSFDVYVQGAGGGYTAYTPARPARTYLGTVVEYPGAIAAAQMRDDGSLRTTIIFEDGTQWKGTSFSMSLPAAASFTPGYPTTLVPAGGAGSTVYGADVAFDLTSAFYSATGSNVANALEMVEYCMIETNAVYLRDTAILQRIGRVVLRTSSADEPYSGSSDPVGLLSGVRGQWNDVLPSVLPSTSYDLAAVIRPGASGGLGYIGAIGTATRYSANGSNGDGNFTQIWRHEAGHNWGSDHYEGGGTPEGPTIMSGNSLSRFSSSELAKIIALRTSKTGILNNLGAYSYPLPPRANGDRVQLGAAHSAVILDVLANDSDSNGEALTILSFDTGTDKGGTITRSTGTGTGGRDQLIYTPGAGFLPTSATVDTFKYRIQDASGQQAISYVAVKAAAQPASPWTGADIGSTGVTGSSYLENGTYTLNGAGADIYGTADGFRFLYQPLSGDGEIVARVASIENTNGWAKSGVMIRESLTGDAKNAFMGLSPANGFFSQSRATTGGSTVNTGGVGGSAPGWVKLVRAGSTFSASSSTDGVTWTLIATHTVSMSTDVYIGVATSAHNNTTLCTATFDNVKVSTPIPPVWSGGDIGAVAAAGSQSYNSGPGSYTIAASGADIWTTADEFRYVRQSLSGDGEIIARVASIQNTHGWAKAGVMIRESLNANSTHVLMGLGCLEGFISQYRSTTGGASTSVAGIAGSAPAWVKLNRTGNTFTSSRSSDGTNWTVVATQSVTMASNIYIGLAVSSHNDGVLCTGVFDNVSVTP